MLTIINSIPEGLLERQATELYKLLPGPTLMHLQGKREPPLFVSVLMHGNEDTGWCAIRELLRQYQDKPLPRSLSVLIGNVEAARYGQRFLDHQPDYNRIWNISHASGEPPEYAMVRQVVDEMKKRQVFASVDIHNNTGINPHYACVNKLDNAFLHLATLFSRTVVYFTTPHTVQSIAFAKLCPSVTVECGQPGQAHGPQHALEYIDACLHLSGIPTHPVASHDMDLFHTVAIAKVPEHISFGFGEGQGDVHFMEDLDHLNFRELPINTLLAKVNGLQTLPLDVRDEGNNDVGKRYFVVEGGQLRTRIPFMPSMLTVNAKAIRQDCLCYLMERYQD
ncbi:MAG: M14 family metallopeptidase [Gammaproteobacteria bacterium]|nr:M14 family metallopeptidase [Gammaproteobacteria bacterium]